MSEVTVSEAPTAPAPGIHWTRRLGWVLLVLWLIVVALIWGLGARQASYGDLQRDLDSGQISHLTVFGGLGTNGGNDYGTGAYSSRLDVTGYATVEVAWRTRWGGHLVTVMEARPLNGEARSAARNNGVQLLAAGPSMSSSTRTLRSRWLRRTDRWIESRTVTRPSPPGSVGRHWP